MSKSIFESQICQAKINQILYYRYNEYLREDEINISGISIIRNGSEKREKFTNIWPEIKYNLRTRIKLSLDIEAEVENLFIPIIELFGKIDDYILIQYLAIIEEFIPEIKFNFYQSGEKYGVADFTKVKNDNRIVKFIRCIEDNNSYTVRDYCKNKIEKLEEVKLNKIVKDYLESHNDENAEKEKESVKNSSSYESSNFNDTYYNDQLDMDQQGPEFWDSQ